MSEINLLLFTYGTLMQGEARHPYLESSVFLGSAIAQNFELHSVETVSGGVADFPAAVPSSTKTIKGELYRITDPNVWRNICTIESTPEVFLPLQATILVDQPITLEGDLEIWQTEETAIIFALFGYKTAPLGRPNWRES